MNYFRYVIYVKEGVYDETVVVTKDMVNVTMFGDGSQKSIITGSKNFVDGVSTFKTASFGRYLKSVPFLFIFSFSFLF